MRTISRIALNAGAITGLGLTVIALSQFFPAGIVVGVDLVAYIRAGTAIREGGPIYTTGIATSGAFLYPPSWAVLFAPLSLLPGAALQTIVMLLDVLAMRYVVGSWRNAGLVGLFPLTWFELASGNVEFLIAGAIVAAWKQTTIPLAVMSFSKLSPAFALDFRKVRAFVVTCAVLIAMTAPWFYLWPEYVQFLLRQPAVAGTVVPIPWYTRLPIAVLLLVPRRPWTSALAAVVATPIWFWYTTLILLAPLRLWVDQQRETARAWSS